MDVQLSNLQPIDPVCGRVVGFTAYPWNHALTHIRLQAPIQQAGMQLLRGNDYERVYLEKIALADLVVIQRDFPRWTTAYQQVIACARAASKPVVYEIDDLLLELPETHPDHSVHYYTQALFPMLQAIVEADAVTATTQALADYLQTFNPTVYVLPNYLDEAIWEYKQPLPLINRVVIGYVGSSTHTPDLETITPALERILARYGDRIRLKFWSCEPPAGLRSWAEVEWLPVQFSDYGEYARYLAGLDLHIGLAPLADNGFNRCKSPVKFLEYSAVGIVGIYSRLPPYEMIVCQGENGFLASSSEEWEECLVRLIEDESQRVKLGSAAQECVRKDWVLSVHAHQWQAVYDAVIQAARSGVQARPTDLRQQRLLRFVETVQNWQHRLTNQVDNQSQQINELEAQVDDQRQRILKLEKQLAEVFSSRAGRLVRSLWRLRLRLAPHGGRVERVFGKLIRPFRPPDSPV